MAWAVMALIVGFFGGSFYSFLEAQKKEKKEQDASTEQYFKYRKLLAESQKAAEAHESLDWRDTLAVAQATMAERGHTEEWSNMFAGEQFLCPTDQHRTSFMRAVGDWAWNAHTDYSDAKATEGEEKAEVEPPVVRVAVCSLDCRSCMAAVERTPGGVPFIMVSENFPHDDEGAG